jgi:hypothetical protein
VSSIGDGVYMAHSTLMSGEQRAKYLLWVK